MSTPTYLLSTKILSTTRLSSSCSCSCSSSSSPPPPSCYLFFVLIIIKSSSFVLSSFSRFFIIFWLLSLCSPQESEEDGALLTAEVLIECLRESQTNVVSRLREEIATGTTIFNSKYFEIQYTGEQFNRIHFKNTFTNIANKLPM